MLLGFAPKVKSGINLNMIFAKSKVHPDVGNNFFQYRATANFLGFLRFFARSGFKHGVKILNTDVYTHQPRYLYKTHAS